MIIKNSTITVGFPLYQGCTLLDFTGATQMFTPYTGADFKPIWLASEKIPILTTEGVSVIPNETFKSAPEIDIIFVPGGGGDGVSQAMLDDAFIESLNKLADKATWTGSVCTGAFILAAAAHFQGLTATTYWSQLENLALFPKITVPQNEYPRGIIHPEAKVFSGGGVSSSIDLALDLIHLIRGKETCQTVELANQYAPDPPFRSGNPAEAPCEITDQLRKAQEGFTKQMREATEKAIAKLAS